MYLKLSLKFVWKERALGPDYIHLFYKFLLRTNYVLLGFAIGTFWWMCRNATLLRRRQKVWPLGRSFLGESFWGLVTSSPKWRQGKATTWRERGSLRHLWQMFCGPLGNFLQIGLLGPGFLKIFWCEIWGVLKYKYLWWHKAFSLLYLLGNLFNFCVTCRTS